MNIIPNPGQRAVVGSFIIQLEISSVNGNGGGRAVHV